jgi:hypothetical protein
LEVNILTVGNLAVDIFAWHQDGDDLPMYLNACFACDLVEGSRILEKAFDCLPIGPLPGVQLVAEVCDRPTAVTNISKTL